MADVIGTELDLVAVLGGAWGHRHHAGVVYEDIEAGRGGGEGVGGLFDGVKRGEVEFQKGDVGVGNLFFDGGNGGLGFGRSAGGEVNPALCLAS